MALSWIKEKKNIHVPYFILADRYHCLIQCYGDGPIYILIPSPFLRIFKPCRYFHKCCDQEQQQQQQKVNASVLSWLYTQQGNNLIHSICNVWLHKWRDTRRKSVTSQSNFWRKFFCQNYYVRHNELDKH